MYVPAPKETPVVAQDELYNPPYVKPPASERIETPYPIFGLVEDLMLGILRPVFEPMGIRVLDQHNKDIDTPLILVRSSRAGGNAGFYPDDTRFTRSARVAVSAIMDGPEADVQCGQLMEAVQQTVLRAQREQTVVPGAGCISFIRAWVDPVRVADFQTATNIVQYASLPRGAVRYEQNFNIIVRPDNQVNANPFLTNSFQKG